MIPPHEPKQGPERDDPLTDLVSTPPEATEVNAGLPPLGAPHPGTSPTAIEDSERMPRASDTDQAETLIRGPAHPPPPDTRRATRPDQTSDEAPVAHGRVASYELRKELARGGMGAVYLAYHPRLKREVALKVMLAGRDASAKQLARFQREAEAAGRLQHPGIVAVHDVGQDQGLHYLVMDLVDGPSLDRVIRDEGPLPLRRAAEITRTLAEALGYAHSRAILHRDMKPANVLLDPEGRAQITDFGLAKNLDVEDELTKTGAIMGTPAYMPPEQARGDAQAIDRRADVYSLGATLYAMLTGKAPFKGKPVKVIYQVLRVEPTPPGKLRPDLDRDLETICLRCLEKDPARRYGTAQALADDLGRYLAHEPIHARRPSAAERLAKWVRRNRVLATVLATAALLLLTVGGGALIVLPRRERARVADEARTAAHAAMRQAEAADAAALGPALAALQAAQRWRDLAPQDPDATRGLFDAVNRLAEVALASEQWDLAQQCFEQSASLGVDDAAARTGLTRVEDARQAISRAHRIEIEALLQRAREGELAREPDGLLNAVFSIVRYPEPQTVELLANELDAVSDRLLAVEREVLVERVDPETSEAGALEAIEEVLQARASLAGRGELPEETALELKNLTLLALGARDINLRQLRTLMAKRQGKVLGYRLDAARVACEALGRIGASTRAEEALARYLDVEYDQDRALIAAKALLRLKSKLGLRTIFRVQSLRHGSASRFTDGLRPLLASAGVELPSDDLSEAQRLHLEGEQHLRRAEYSEARDRFLEVLELEPDNGPAWANLGSARTMLGDAEGAEAALDRALELDPDSELLHFNLGELAFARGDLQRALTAYDRAVELNPTNGAYLRARGKLKHRMGDLQSAIADFDEALKREPGAIESWLARGDCHYALGDLPVARADYEHALTLDPDHPRALANRGYCRCKQGEVEAGLLDLERAVELGPGDTQAWDMFGNSLYASGNFAPAAEAYARLLELDPQRAQARAARGFCFLALGALDRAIPEFDLALELDPRSLPALMGRADALLQSGDHARSVGAYDALLAIEPRHDVSWNNRGCALLVLERFADALESFDRALALSPQWAAPLSNRGDALDGLGRVDEALDAYARAIGFDPEFAEPRIMRAGLHLREGHPQEALADAEVAVGLAPEDARGWTHLGRARRALEDSTAAEALRRALQLDPQLTDVAAELKALEGAPDPAR